jgi:hypothetical protein
MGIGLGESGAVEHDPRQVPKIMVGRVEIRVLAGQDNQAVEPARRKRGGNR